MYFVNGSVYDGAKEGFLSFMFGQQPAAGRPTHSNQQFGNAENNFGNAGNQFENAGNQFGNAGNQFGNAGNQYGNAGNQYGNEGNQFGNNVQDLRQNSTPRSTVYSRG